MLNSNSEWHKHSNWLHRRGFELTAKNLALIASSINIWK